MAFWKSPVDSTGLSPSPLAPWCQVADLSDGQTGEFVIVPHLPHSYTEWPTFVGVLAKCGLWLKWNTRILFLLVMITFKHDFRHGVRYTTITIRVWYNKLLKWLKALASVNQQVNCSKLSSGNYFTLNYRFTCYICHMPFGLCSCGNQIQGDGGRMSPGPASL